MKELRQITIAGLGLLGGSLSLAVLRGFTGVRVVGFAHRASTRAKAAELSISSVVSDNLLESVAKADVVVLATPVRTFPDLFESIADALPHGCIVTDVGSTKSQVHRWAAELLPGHVNYVGSHPIAGSEQRGVEFARDDLFDGARTILTANRRTSAAALAILEAFWTGLGCTVQTMNPVRHDRVYANVSHVPHVASVALVNATRKDDMQYCGKGFLDTSRIASSAADIWTDVLLTNGEDIIKGIDRLTEQLGRIKAAVAAHDRARIKQLLARARTKRAELIEYRVSRKELE